MGSNKSAQVEALIHFLELLLTPAMAVGLLVGVAAALVLEWLTPVGADPTFGQAALVVLGLVLGGIYTGVTSKKA